MTKKPESDAESDSGLDLPYDVGSGRGLMSQSERDALLDKKSASYKSQTWRKIVNRVCMISDDLEFIAEVDPDLYDKLMVRLELPDKSYLSSDLKDDVEEIKEMQREILENQTND